MIAFQDIIKGQRLVLKKCSFEHFSEFCDVVDKNSNHLAKYLPWARNYSHETLKEFLLSRENQEFPHNNFVDYFIFVNNSLVGSIGLSKISKQNKRAEVGFWLSKEHTGSGYGQESLKLITKQAFSLNFHRIGCKIDASNKKSIHLVRKCGYQKEGLMKSYYFENNNFVDISLYSIIS